MFVSFEAADVALRSVGTALTLSSAGFYLHSRGFISEESQKAFGRYIQQVGLPSFFFTKLVQCPAHDSPQHGQNGESSSMICPSILDHLSEAWILLVWPLYVIGCGLFVGQLIAWWTKAPKRQHSTIMLCTGFGNSATLPTTLLLVLHQHSVNRSGAANQVDPNAFLSLFLILHPMLLWSLGSWLAEPSKRGDSSVAMYQVESGGRTNTDVRVMLTSEATESGRNGIDYLATHSKDEQSRLIPVEKSNESETTLSSEPKTFWSSLSILFTKACQPPVIGSLLGITVTLLTPLRQFLVQKNGPLDWWFDGLLKIGSSSIPLSMAVLGMSLSQSLQKYSHTDNENDDEARRHRKSVFSCKTMTCIILGKLVILPIIGFGSVTILRNCFGISLNSPSMSMALLIVWLTPTANNAVVIADLVGGYKEAMAQLLAWQYVVVPAILSVTVACMIRVSGLDVS